MNEVERGRHGVPRICHRDAQICILHTGLGPVAQIMNWARGGRLILKFINPFRPRAKVVIYIAAKIFRQTTNGTSWILRRISHTSIVRPTWAEL